MSSMSFSQLAPATKARREAALCVLLMMPAPVAAWAQATQEFRVAPATSTIEIDGRLEEPAWQQAAPIPVKYEIFPGDNTAARVDTTCFVTFDQDRLYFACR